MTLSGWLPSVADSRGLQGKSSAVAGTVSDRQGRPIAGAPVHMEVWPSKARQAAMTASDHLDTVPVAKTVTDESGRYNLVLGPSVLRGYKVGDLVDITVGAWTAEDGPVVINSTIEIANPGLGRSSSRDLAAFTSEGARLDDKPMSIDLQLGSLGNADLPQEHGATAIAEDVDSSGKQVPSDDPTANGSDLQLMAHGCPYSVKDRGKKRVIVGNINIPATNVNGRFHYLESASSSLGVGVSGSGAYGSYSAGGKTTVKRTNETTFPKTFEKSSHLNNTYFRYKTFCTSWHSPGPERLYTTKATNGAGGAWNTSTTAFVPLRQYCSPYSPGSSEVIKTHKSITWTNGAKLGSTIGIDLSAQTGFTFEAKSRYNFPASNSNSKWLCGQGGDIGNSYNAVARNRLP